MSTCAASVLVAVNLLVGGCGPRDSGEGRPNSSPDGGDLRFTDISAAAGLGGFRHSTGAVGQQWFPESMGSGGGFVDYDGDGWLDVVLAGGGSWPGEAGADAQPVRSLVLYRNVHDGTFEDVTAAAGLSGIAAYTIGVTAADYDNDGDSDLYVTTLGDNLLLDNNDGVFVDRAAEAGVTGDSEWSTSAAFFDADRDGHLDLYVGNYVDWTPENDIWCTLDGEKKAYCTPELYDGTASRFYHNNGNGTFSDWSQSAGFLPAPGKTLGVVEYDINRDGWPDLFVSDDTQPNLFYVNDGDGTFTEQGALSGMAYDENGKARAGMGIDVGVVDGSGQPTLFVGNFSKEMISVYRYSDNGLFLDRSGSSRIGQPSLLTLTFGLFLFDADLDGDLDLFAANGHVQPEIEDTQEGIRYAEPPHLFVNDGDGTFADMAAATGDLARPLVARSASYGDFDGDGDLDILVTENGGPAHLMRNDAVAGRSFRLRLVGVESNRDGISSRVVFYSGGRSHERLVRTGSSMLSVSERVLTIGLGDSASVDSLVVYWSSGAMDVLGSRSGAPVPAVPPGGEVVLTEGGSVRIDS